MTGTEALDMVERPCVCGDLRHRHWLLNGRNLRHVCSSFHHLRQDLLNFDHACDVIRTVAQLLSSTANQDYRLRCGALNFRTPDTTSGCGWDSTALRYNARLHRLVRSVVGLNGCCGCDLWWLFCEQSTAPGKPSTGTHPCAAPIQAG